LIFLSDKRRANLTKSITMKIQVFLSKKSPVKFRKAKYFIRVNPVKFAKYLFNRMVISVAMTVLSPFCGEGGWVYAQVGVGINTTGAPPAPSAILDVQSTNQGILIPRVSLTNAALGDHSADPVVPNPNNRLFVFNNNAAVPGGNGVGLYYYDSISPTLGKWVYVAAPSNGPGTPGQVLVSQGSGNPPQWSTLSISSGGAAQGTALGSAMMTAYMDSLGLFRPHTSASCDAATEAFVPLYPGATVGFCIEKNERPAQSWTNAIRTCLSVGKRLPEPFEWQVACDNAATLGLSNMTTGFEWASNFAIPVGYYNGISNHNAVVVPDSPTATKPCGV